MYMRVSQKHVVSMDMHRQALLQGCCTELAVDKITAALIMCVFTFVCDPLNVLQQ